MADGTSDDRENSETITIYPYPGKTKSSVWRFFGFKKTKPGPPSKETLDMRTVVCRLCLKTYANKGNTTNLQQHLTSVHRKEHELHSTSLPVKAHVKLVQLKINQPVPVTKAYGPGKKQELDDRTLKLVVGKALPLSLVTNTHFKALAVIDFSTSPVVHGQCKSIEVQTPKQTRHPAEKKRLAMKNSLRNELPLATRLREVVSHWNIPSSPTVVTDNAANEKKAIQILGWERFGCYGHIINLVVKHALEVPEVARILGKNRKLVTLFHQSTSLNDSLLEKQRQVISHNPSQKGLKLIQVVATRWNSSLDMLERVSAQSAAIFATASDDKLSKSISSSVKSCCLTFEEQLTV